MNEKLVKFASNAGFDIGIHDGMILGNFSDMHRCQKFAELIIKECARVARATYCPYEDPEVRERLGHTWDMACNDSGNSIIEYFGIK